MPWRLDVKSIILIVCLLLPILATAFDEYDSKYCHDPVELQKWANMLAEDPDSDVLAVIHTLWIGLCAKVEAHNITTERANRIFEDFKWGIIESVKDKKEKPEKEPA